MIVPSRRWPPVHDADGLRQMIEELATDGLSRQRPFYDATAMQNGLLACQGDVLTLKANVPVLNAEGRTAAIAAPSEHWLVVSNTCDLTRTAGDMTWMLLSPLTLLSGHQVTDAESDALRRYRPYRRFYLPMWSGNPVEHGAFADLTCIVSADRAALSAYATVVARMSRLSWVLLNACLVRFLARDDGREEP